ncbi:ATP-binding protein [Paenibacillus sp. EKM208P]|nr:ATP-binding protein [Paenibacillus sp. EKM208P]
MNVFLKKSYLSRLINALSLFNGSEFELFGHCVLERLLGYKLNHRGLTISGAPSGYTVDSYNDDLSIIGEYSVEDDYFSSGFTKILKDLEHALKTSPNLKVLYLFTSKLPGPKRSIEVRRAINQALSSANRKVKVNIFDAKMIANYLIFKIGDLDNSSELVVNLPELESILYEHIMTNTIPPIKENYLKRCEEDKILEILENQDAGLIYGISGIGKTEVAISIAQKLKNQFEVAVWIDGKDINPESLKSLYVERAGFKQNLIGLFHRRRLLLIIDGLENQASEVMKTLLDSNKHGSKIIITSQKDETLIPSDNKILLGFLNEDKAQNLLNIGVNELCTESVFGNIYRTIGGHPLTAFNH